MPFSDLSSELLLSIADHLTNPTLLSFSITNKSVYGLCAPTILNRRRYEARYSRIQFPCILMKNPDRSRGTIFKHPAEVLDEISRDPRAAETVRHIGFDIWFPPVVRHFKADATPQNCEAIKDQLDRQTIKALQNIGYGISSIFEFDEELLESTAEDTERWGSWYDEDWSKIFPERMTRDIWISEAKKGNPNVFLVILLSKCPKLRSFALYGTPIDGLDQYILPFIRRAVERNIPLFARESDDETQYFKDSQKSDSNTVRIRESFRGLKNFETLEIHNEAEEMFLLPDYDPWLSIPTLRRVVGLNFCSTKNRIDEAIYSSAGQWRGFSGSNCKWTELDIEDGALTPADFARFMVQAPMLEKIRFRMSASFSCGSKERAPGPHGAMLCEWKSAEDWVQLLDKELSEQQKPRKLGVHYMKKGDHEELYFSTGHSDHRTLSE